ncbi:MAG: hypothetical protein GXO78_15010 [Calditrichaeota bacterium]|nr:hypothetical protein [Calditrichota bacterium]
MPIFVKLWMIHIALLGLMGLFLSEGFAGDGVVEGKLICLACALSCPVDADRSDSEYPHLGVLQTENADIWYFEETPESRRLLQDESLRNKRVRVYGTLDSTTHRIRVHRWELLP